MIIFLTCFRILGEYVLSTTYCFLNTTKIILKITEVVNYRLELQKIPCWKGPLEIICSNLQPIARL